MVVVVMVTESSTGESKKQDCTPDISVTTLKKQVCQLCRVLLDYKE